MPSLRPKRRSDHVQKTSRLDRRRCSYSAIRDLCGHARFHSRFCFQGIVAERVAHNRTRGLARRKRRNHRHAPESQDGGWLVLDKSYQDVEFYTEFRCARIATQAFCCGRRRRPDGGWKGVYVSLAGEGGPYDVTLNADGKELNRTRLLRATAQFARMAAGPWTNGAGPRAGLRQTRHDAGRGTGRSVANRPPLQPAAARRRAAVVRAAAANQASGEWNTLDVIVDADMVWTDAQRTPRREFGDQRPHDGFRPGRAACRGTRRGAIPRRCHSRT